MTAATPGRELPEVSRDEYERLIDAIDYTLAVNGKIEADTPLHERIRKAYRVPGVTRLAAKPADEGERERCIAIIQAARFGELDNDFRAIKSMIEGGLTVEQLKAFSTTGEPKR